MARRRWRGRGRREMKADELVVVVGLAPSESIRVEVAWVAIREERLGFGRKKMPVGREGGRGGWRKEKEGRSKLIQRV